MAHDVSKEEFDCNRAQVFEWRPTMPDDAPKIETGNVLLTIPQGRVAQRTCLFPKEAVSAEAVAEAELPNILAADAAHELLEAWYVGCPHGCSGQRGCTECPPDRGAVKARVRVGLPEAGEAEDVDADEEAETPESPSLDEVIDGLRGRLCEKHTEQAGETLGEAMDPLVGSLIENNRKLRENVRRLELEALHWSALYFQEKRARQLQQQGDEGDEARYEPAGELDPRVQALIDWAVPAKLQLYARGLSNLRILMRESDSIGADTIAGIPVRHVDAEEAPLRMMPDVLAVMGYRDDCGRWFGTEYKLRRDADDGKSGDTDG